MDTQGVYESRTRYLIFLSGSEEGTDDHGCALIKRLHILWYIGLCNYVPRNWRNQETVLGEEVQYKLELIMEELSASLYAAVIQQSSALTLMYCVDLIVIIESLSI